MKTSIMNSNTEVEEAKAVLEKEANAIREVANRLDPEKFTKAVDILQERWKDHCYRNRKIWTCW